MIAKDLALLLAQCEVSYSNSTDEQTGPFFCLIAVAGSAVVDLTLTEASGEGSISAMPLPEETPRFGPFATYQKTSGSYVLAYKMPVTVAHP